MSDRFASTCGWARPSVKHSEEFFCKKVRRTFGEADRGLGICPCFYFVKCLEAKNAKTGKKGREKKAQTLWEPEEKA